MKAIGDAAWRRLRHLSKPLAPSDLRALSPIVVLAPHADDETLGCGGLLATAAAQGLNPRVVYLTDGSASHRNSDEWPPKRLAEQRRSEALAALGVLGLTLREVLFLDWTDASPFADDSPGYEATFRQLTDWLDTFAPNSLWAPRAGESHCDHEAASALADAVARQSRLRRLDYMVWGWGDRTVAKARVGERVWGLTCRAFIAQRRKALACHQSQTTGLIADAEDAFLIPPNVAALAARPVEIFIERQ